MKTITIFYKEKSEACKKAIQWTKEHHFQVELKNIETITHREIFQLIYLSGVDIPDILEENNKYAIGYQFKKNHLKKLRFGEELIYLEQHVELLQLPIILSNEKATSGFDEQKMSTFLQ